MKREVTFSKMYLNREAGLRFVDVLVDGEQLAEILYTESEPGVGWILQFCDKLDELLDDDCRKYQGETLAAIKKQVVDAVASAGV